MALKPNEEIMTSALTAVVVVGIFQANLNKLSDVKANNPNVNIHNSTKAASWEAAAVVAGIAILAKSPTIFVVGATVAVAEAWKYHYANNTKNGKYAPAINAVINSANQ